MGDNQSILNIVQNVSCTLTYMGKYERGRQYNPGDVVEKDLINYIMDSNGCFQELGSLHDSEPINAPAPKHNCRNCGAPILGKHRCEYCWTPV